MSAYRTVVVGTDGSESSLLAVRRAGALAGACRARLVIVCAYLPPRADEREARRAQEQPGEDSVQVVGSPVETLIDVVTRAQADLLVVGNRGLNSLRGRLMGSVPADVTRRSAVDVLVVHTTG